MSVVPFRKVKRIKVAHASNPISASILHEYLEPTTTVVITFRTEKQMINYRKMIYTINKQGTYRYRTIREETSMWGIVIWRMK